jgi:hypothetical protein
MELPELPKDFGQPFNVRLPYSLDSQRGKHLTLRVHPATREIRLDFRTIPFAFLPLIKLLFDTPKALLKPHIIFNRPYGFPTWIRFQNNLFEFTGATNGWAHGEVRTFSLTLQDFDKLLATMQREIPELLQATFATVIYGCNQIPPS